jgi:hypothetical protein
MMCFLLCTYTLNVHTAISIQVVPEQSRKVEFSNDASQKITTLLYIKRACELNKSHIISTDDDPGLRIESFAVINLRGVSTNKTIIHIYMMCFLLCTYTLNVHTAISIQVVPEQSIKVEYERERLGIAKKLMNFLDSQQAFRARNRVPLCSGTTLIKIAVYVYIMYALYDQRTSSSLETSRSHTTFKAHFHSRKFSTDRKFSENIIVKS